MKGGSLLTENTECPLLASTGVKAHGFFLRRLLAPLDALDPRERMILLEHTYWRTNMKIVAGIMNIHPSKAYLLLERAKQKLSKVPSSPFTSSPDESE